MTQENALNHALNLLEETGPEQAYLYLKNHSGQWEHLDSQYYNFLYCLASIIGKDEEALAYLEEAIVERGLWYRPQVFEDDDLDNIRDTERFKRCKSISDERFYEAEKSAQTICTWNAKEKNCLALALHGNQQNIQDSQNAWGFLEALGYQVEYVQSKHIDSYGIYRWEDNLADEEQLKKVLESTMWHQYEETVLCGFSAGCHVILKAMLDEAIECDTLILQSPWIPLSDASLEELTLALRSKKTRVFIMCGKDDRDCFDQSLRLYQKLKFDGVKVSKQWIEHLGHEFSPNYTALVKDFLEGEDED